jgi:hypothetical protein
MRLRCGCRSPRRVVTTGWAAPRGHGWVTATIYARVQVPGDSVHLVPPEQVGPRWWARRIRVNRVCVSNDTHKQDRLFTFPFCILTPHICSPRPTRHPSFKWQRPKGVREARWLPSCRPTVSFRQGEANGGQGLLEFVGMLYLRWGHSYRKTRSRESSSTTKYTFEPLICGCARSNCAHFHARVATDAHN